MTRNNVRLLTPTEFMQLNSKYIFELDKDSIVVRTKNYNRLTKHPVNEPFHINAKGIRKVCFNMNAIDIWKNLYKDGKPTLIEVQQAVNKLTITFQKTTEENVKKILAGHDIKIKKI